SALMADILAVWSTGSGVSRERVRIAAERVVARHGGGKLVLTAMVNDFMMLMREEGMTMPPDLLLIFKALITIDGVLSGIEPGFDLSQAMRRSSTKIARTQLSPERWSTTLQGL